MSSMPCDLQTPSSSHLVDATLPPTTQPPTHPPTPSPNLHTCRGPTSLPGAAVPAHLPHLTLLIPLTHSYPPPPNTSTPAGRPHLSGPAAPAAAACGAAGGAVPRRCKCSKRWGGLLRAGRSAALAAGAAIALGGGVRWAERGVWQVCGRAELRLQMRTTRWVAGVWQKICLA